MGKLITSIKIIHFHTNDNPILSIMFSFLKKKWNLKRKPFETKIY
jgi:hypothetical protein